jgi:arylsulfatase
MMKKTNVCVIFTEQHRGDCLSCEGHPVLLTPNIDELWGKGARCSHAYSAASVCVPARRSFLSGQFPETYGIFGNPNVEWNAPTLPGILGGKGYQTYMIGRSMHQTPVWKRYGFDHMEIFDHRADRDDYDRYLEQYQPPGSGGYYGTGVMHNDWSARSWHMSDGLHRDAWTTNRALDFLQRRDPSSPYFMVCSYIGAHPPLIPPRFYFDRYLRTGVPDPVIGDWAVKPPDDGLGFGVCPAGPERLMVNLKGEALLSCRAGYYGLINHIDDQLHRIFIAIEKQNKKRNEETIFIFFSDHGEMLGDHYLWRKGLPYEGSSRIPFLVRAPERFGITPRTIVDAPVGIEDIMPTVLEMLDVDVPDSVDGRSILPLLQGKKAEDWRPYMHLESACTIPFQGLTDGEEKFVWFTEDGREQFFDLKSDPGETRNLIDDPERQERIRWWREELTGVLENRPEGFVKNGKLTPAPFPVVQPGRGY